MDNVGFNIPSWAISVEFWAYIGFAVCCLVLGGRFLLLANYFYRCLSLLLYVLSGEETKWYGNMLRCLAGISLGSAAYLLLTKLKGYRFNVLIMTALEGSVVIEILVFLWLASQRRQKYSRPPMVVADRVRSSDGCFFVRRRNDQQSSASKNSKPQGDIFLLDLHGSWIYLSSTVSFLAGLTRVGGLDFAISKPAGTAIILFLIGIIWYVARWTYNRIERPGLTVLPTLARAVCTT